MDKFFKGKKARYGTFTIALIALVLVGVVLINFIAVVLTERLGLRFDITDNRIYEISSTTTDLLKNLQDDIQITVLATEEQYMNNTTYLPIREILLKYEQLSGGKLSVRYVDPYLNADVVKQYTSVSSTPSARDIIVESSLRFKTLSPSDMYALSTSYTSETYDTGLVAEQKFSSAIMYCTAEVLPKVYRIMGHNEGDLTELNSLMSSANYSLDMHTLTVGDVPTDASLIIINNPTSDFSETEIERLDAYFERGGNAIIFYDVSVPTLPVFERFMAEWGVRYNDYFVCDDNWSYQSSRTILPSITSHDLASGVKSTGEYLIADMARAMTVLFNDKNYRTVSPILTSSTSSYGKTPSGKSSTTYSREAGDVSGPFSVAVLSEYYNPNDGTNSKILFSSTGIAMDNALAYNNFLNQKFVVSALNYMNEQADSVIVEARYFNSNALNVTEAQANAVFWFMCVILPAAIFVTGIVVWVKRRNM